MLLDELVAVSAAVAETSSRRGKIDRLASLLKRLQRDEVAIAINFLSGSLRQGSIGVGGSLVWQAKPGEAASSPALDLHDVDRALEAIAQASGEGSTALKVQKLRELLVRATAQEQDFLLRLLYGELRQGAAEGLMIEAVARASGVPAASVRAGAMAAGSLPDVACVALFEGETALSRFSVRVFQPVRPMLADSADDLEAAIVRIGEASLEYKLDGARIQVHKAGGEVKVFSRQMREVTPAVPDVVEIVRAFPAGELILDGEVIALRPDRRPHPFQVTMQRFGRKLDVERLRQELPLTPFFFDALDIDGTPLIDEPQARRFASLVDLVPGGFVVPSVIAATPEDARLFLDEAMRQGHEGVMAKMRSAPYAAGNRGQAWLKVKPARTLDLVVLAAEWGHGRRQGWLSNLHLGARDAERGGFVMLGKTFKGLTDQMLAWQTEKLLSLEIARDRFTVHVRPELVVEIAFNDIQVSPQYPGNLALRFARVKRFRPDKPAEQADTLATLQAIYSRMTGLEPPPRR
jgi:DNA ligase-1